MKPANRRVMRLRIGVYPLAMLAIGVAAIPAGAQGVPVLQRGNLELSGFGLSDFGSTTGGIISAGSAPGVPPFSIVTPSSNGGGGVQFDVAVARRVRLYAEWSFMAGGRVEFNQDYFLATGNPTTTRQSLIAETSTWDAQGGAQFLLPMKALPRFVPYVSGGLGVLGTRGGGSGAIIGASANTPFSYSGSVQTRAVTGSFGIGARYYFTERAGLRFELDGFLGWGPATTTLSLAATTLAVANEPPRFGRVGFGVFYQFH